MIYRKLSPHTDGMVGITTNSTAANAGETRVRSIGQASRRP